MASKGLGAIHFIGQTVADVAVETESAIKLKAYRVEKKDTRAQRVYTTLAYQQKVIDTYSHSLASFQLMRDKMLKRGVFSNDNDAIVISVQEALSEELQSTI